MNKKRLDMKRLTVDIDPEKHFNLKIIALKYNITMTELVIRMIDELFIRESKLDKE